MRRLNIVLAGVLVAQLLLAGALLWNTQRYALVRPGQPLVAFDRNEVDGIVIDTREEGSITLQKTGRNWSLPSRAGFPAAQSKIDSFLATLDDLKPRLPVAVTADARQRFHVGAKDFERRITLKHGKDALATLYLGDSAGPSKVFARAGAGDAVYEIAFETWQASTRPNQWMNRNLLQQNPNDIVRIDLPSFTLQRKNDKWQVAGLATDAGTNEQEAGRIVDRLASLTFEDTEGKAKKAIDGPAPELSYTLTLKDGRSLKYRFSKTDKGNDYLLRTSASDYIFKVSKETVDEIHGFKRDALVRKSSKGEAPDKAATTGSAGNADIRS
ncbi:MAG TPA: DUF4340 domain-containing protein [Nitrococcus sp.]|nr:DUF4340 domain-containing protein [Nitrococcus sp.]